MIPPPILESLPLAQMYRTEPLIVAQCTWTTILWDIVTVDTHGGYQRASGRYHSMAPGMYLAAAAVELPGSFRGEAELRIEGHRGETSQTWASAGAWFNGPPLRAFDEEEFAAFVASRQLLAATGVTIGQPMWDYAAVRLRLVPARAGATVLRPTDRTRFELLWSEP